MADKISLATLALAKAYTDESIEGAGAIKGKNCQIQSITNIEGGHRVTFAWYNESQVLLTDTLDVMDGEDGAKGDTGNGIVKIEKTATSGLTDTYTITFTDGTTFDYDVVNGADGAVLSVNGKTGNVTLTTSDLVNDSGFIQNTVNNLVNYYLKSQIYTKTEVDNIVAAISTLSLSPVEQLPTTDISTTTIYLIPSSTQGVMDQYINLDGTTTGWVKIGDTSIDLTNYVTTSDLTLALADYVTEAELSTYVVDANYVHTDNNYTDTDKAIVGGVTSALAGKADKSEIPENTSDLTNDSGFITNTVNNLANYYLKSQTYTQSEVDALIAAVKNGRFISVATLPTTDIDTKAIYLVPSADPQTGNIKDEYINTDGTSAGWELIGSTAIDLSGYVTDAELTTALADYTTTANLTTLLAAKQDTISDLATIRSGANAGASAYQKPATGIPKTDLASAVQTSLEKADSAVQDISGKADKVSNATNGNFAGLDASGNLTDSGKSPSDFMASDGVTANPQGTVTGTLTKLGIGSDIYDIQGGGASTLADLTDVNISNPTDGQILQYDATSQKWVNHVNAPEYISITVDIYSAVSDTVTFTDQTGQKTVTTDTDGHGQATIICVNGDSITFTSTVAKNLSDLSQAYSKSVTIGANTTEVYVMPDGAIYWYGNKVNAESMSTANGWSVGGYWQTIIMQFKEPTWSTNYVDLISEAAKLAGVGTHTDVNMSLYNTFNVVVESAYNPKGGLNAGLLYGRINQQSKYDHSENTYATWRDDLSPAPPAKYSLDISSITATTSACWETVNGNEAKISAIWFE